jgi:hypothetical protein
MPKKKVSGPKKTTATKKAPAKSASTKKTVVVKASSAKTLKPVKKSPSKGDVVGKVTKGSTPVTAKTPLASNSPSQNEEVTLGRPLVTQEEKLYMLFHDDYQARQVFEFLRVETVKELEQFSQQQIVHMMSKPLRMTVDRIRQRLAQFKRSLKDDEQFAADFLKRAN